MTLLPTSFLAAPLPLGSFILWTLDCPSLLRPPILNLWNASFWQFLLPVNLNRLPHPLNNKMFISASQMTIFLFRLHLAGEMFILDFLLLPFPCEWDILPILFQLDSLEVKNRRLKSSGFDSVHSPSTLTFSTPTLSSFLPSPK